MTENGRKEANHMTGEELNPENIFRMDKRRIVYEKEMQALYQKVTIEREKRLEKPGEYGFTPFEAVVLEVIGFFLPKKKCRIIMEYDPAKDMIRFFKECSDYQE